MDTSARPRAEADIPDSTDWLGTPLAGLMPVEQAFRCHVCKDFYNSPMVTSCNHTFCSICIRRCLAVDGKCPLCRATDQETKLRGNWALREAVDSFCKARVVMLAFAREPHLPSSQSSLESQPPSPRKRGVDDDDLDDRRGTKRRKASTRRSKRRAMEATTAIAQAEADVPETDVDGMDFEPDDGLAACPICWARMKPMLVDRHIDTTCPGSPQPQAKPKGGDGRTSGPPKPDPAMTLAAPKAPERLPSISYSILNDTALRKKMAALGISTDGPRHLLERRHKEWVTIWNANCDSAHPRRKSELLHDLEVWERTQGGRAPTNSRTVTMGSQIKDKDFDGAAWAAKHDDSFKELIANARKSRQKAQSGNSGSSSGPSADDSESGPRDVVQTKGMRKEFVDLTGPRSSQSDPGRIQSNGAELLGPTAKVRAGVDGAKETGGRRRRDDF